jgi:dTDP-4-amino-4,6-dideoxygalactose transaminase
MSTVTITHKEHSVEIQVDTMTYLYEHAQYAELFRTALQNPPTDVAWQSTLTQEMVEHMSEEDLSNLIEELDSAVEETPLSEVGSELRAAHND